VLSRQHLVRAFYPLHDTLLPSHRRRFAHSPRSVRCSFPSTVRSTLRLFLICRERPRRPPFRHMREGIPVLAAVARLRHRLESERPYAGLQAPVVLRHKGSSAFSIVPRSRPEAYILELNVATM